MPSNLKLAVETYIRAWSERDPVVRATMLERCFAPQGRVLARNSEIAGRSALNDEIARFLDNPEWKRVVLTSPVDAVGNTFRFHSVLERQNGTALEFFDAGTVDEQGQISLVLTFAGPFPAADR
jgi:hypothetical protein